MSCETQVTLRISIVPCPLPSSISLKQFRKQLLSCGCSKNLRWPLEIFHFPSIPPVWASNVPHHAPCFFLDTKKTLSMIASFMTQIFGNTGHHLLPRCFCKSNSLISMGGNPRLKDIFHYSTGYLKTVLCKVTLTIALLPTPPRPNPEPWT